MASIDVFRANAFSMDSMLAAIEHTDYRPQFLGSLNLFSDEPQSTRAVTVESRDNTLALIPTSPIGAPPSELTVDPRKVRTFNTVRIAKRSRIMADEIQGIRAFGSTSELEQVNELVARRLQRLVADVELTHEHHRLGAVQGVVMDADGTTTLVNYFTEFGVQQPSVVDFNFGTLEAGEVRALIEGSITRPMIRAAQGAFVLGSRIIGLCGDDFWDGLVNHAEVRQSFLNWQAAQSLRDATAFSTFPYGGVDWVNYRGTDDNSTVAIGTSDAKFFVQAPGIFQVAWAPAEFLDTVNRPGVPLRPMVLPDPSGRNAFVDIEVYSYPLHICTRPKTLYRATLTT